MLLQWWDENFIRGFLSNRWVVIVSLSEFKEDPLKFWNIIVNINYSWSSIQLTIKWEDLSESTLFVISLWLNPISINYSDNPIPEEQVKDIINTALSKVKEEDKKAKEQAEMEELKEKKKYEESWIEDWLKIINSNIDRIEQKARRLWKWNEKNQTLNQLQQNGCFGYRCPSFIRGSWKTDFCCKWTK